MRIAEFQQLIRDRYHASDSARGDRARRAQRRTALLRADEAARKASEDAEDARGCCTGHEKTVHSSLYINTQTRRCKVSPGSDGAHGDSLP